MGAQGMRRVGGLDARTSPCRGRRSGGGGRHDNTTLVVTDQLRADGHDRDEPATARQVLDAVLARPTAERAALDHLRQTFEHAESLAVLAPRLATVDAWIAGQEPPDRSDELTRAEHQLRHAVERMKPGRLTRGGREDRRHLEHLIRQRDQLVEAQGRRKHWWAANADALDYREKLAEQVATRCRHLGIDAAKCQPAHVVDLLGPYPEDPAQAERWTDRAARIESFREEWGVEPGQLRNPPDDIGTILDGQRFHERLAANCVEPARSQGLSIER